jgi:hypothetical protein
MLNYYDHELIRRPRPNGGARCFRCNTPLSAACALRDEGLCTACAEGKTIQFQSTPARTPSDKRSVAAPWPNGAHESSQMAPPPHWPRCRGQAS